MYPNGFCTNTTENWNVPAHAFHAALTHPQRRPPRLKDVVVFRSQRASFDELGELSPVIGFAKVRNVSFREHLFGRLQLLLTPRPDTVAGDHPSEITRDAASASPSFIPDTLVNVLPGHNGSKWKIFRNFISLHRSF